MRDNWTETSLGAVAEVVGGGTPATSNPAYWDGDIVWLTPTEVVAATGSVLTDSARKITEAGLKNSGARLLPEGTVILTSRASVGFSALAGTSLATNQGFQSLIPSPKVNNRFLMFWIQNNQHEFNSRAAGSTFKEISKANVKSITLTLPPLSEQKRIVDVLAAVDTYIAALQRQAANARAARNAVLHALLTVGGDNWTEVTLGDIATIVPGKYLPKAEYVEDGDYFVYGSNSIMGKYSKFLIEPPHTVMAAIGAYAGAVRYSPLASWVNNNAFGLLVKPSVLPGYFYLWLDLMLDLSTVVAGTGQPYVQRPALRATKLVLPPIVVQHEIVETMTTLDSAIQATDQAIRAATQLRSGLAESLLSGAHEIPETYDHFLGAA